MTAKTRQRYARVRRLLASGKWVTQSALLRAAGHRFGAVLYDLRRGNDGGEPLKIESRAVSSDNSIWRYRATGVDDAPTRPVSLRARVSMLEMENARLRSRLGLVEVAP